MTEGGRLTHGEGRFKVERPANGFAGPWWPVWDPQYNPRSDAPAAILGATMISPNRYRLGMKLLDANGVQRDEEHECPECGAVGDALRMLKVENPNPFAPRWVKAMRWCRTCVRSEVSA